MSKKKSVLFTLSLICFVGCAGIGLVSTSDPYKKLHQADVMMSQGRVPMAEDLIGQAVIIFKKNANENGLADAYHEYGNLYKHDSYHNKWSNYYKQKGTYDGTYIKSIDNYKKAVELFDRLEDESGVVKCLMGIGNAYSLRGEKDKALEYYKDALGRYNMAKKGGRIKVEPIMNNPNYKNMGELLEAFINEERK